MDPALKKADAKSKAEIKSKPADVESNILIATVMWKRHHIFEIWAERMKRLGCDILVVGSEGKASRDLVQKHGFHYVERPNMPLGAKLNARVEFFLARPEYTHILFVGSDDCICSKTLRIIKSHLHMKDLVNWKDCYFYEWGTGRIAYMPGFRGNRKGEPMAPGRCISRRLVQKIGLPFWSTSIKKHPDGNIWKKLKNCSNQITLSCKELGCTILDIKSKENLNSMDSLFKHKLAYLTQSEGVTRLMENIQIGESVKIGKKVKIGKNTIIENNVEIADNCVIGDNCLIQTGSILRANCKIGNNSVLGPYNVVESAIVVAPNSNKPPFSWIKA